MKKFIKICALTGFVLLLAGVGITSVAAALGGRLSNNIPRRFWSMVWEDDDYMDHDYMDHVWKDNDFPASTDIGDGWVKLDMEGLQGGSPPGGAAASARKLDIDVDTCILHVSENKDISQIEIHIKDQYNATRCYLEKETLKIKREWGHKNLKNEDVRIDVLVPSGYQFDKISIDMGAAECHFSQIRTNKLDIDSGVGLVAFTGTVAGDVEVEAGVGDVTLNLADQEQDYNYKVECGIGTIQVGSSSYSMLSHETFINNNAPYHMELECGVGTITVSFNKSI